MKISCPQLGNAGRLGNQLFQIASTVGVAETYNATVQFPPWDYAPYFAVPERWFGPIDPDAVDVTTLVPHLDERARVYLQDFHLVHGNAAEWFRPSWEAEDLLGSRYAEFFHSLPKPVLGVHVRRGDNAYEGPWKAQYHPLRPLSYYYGAIGAKAGQYKSILFFSDDIPWCRENFPDLIADGDTFFFEGGSIRAKEHLPEYKIDPFDDWIDLQVMSWCDMHIISNSTYSWWAAWLGYSGDVTFPWPWFGQALDYIDASLMMPAGWTRREHALGP